MRYEFVLGESRVPDERKTPGFVSRHKRCHFEQYQIVLNIRTLLVIVGCCFCSDLMSSLDHLPLITLITF